MRIFISYSHRDSEHAHLIASRLEKEGHDIWIDRLKIKPGDNIPQHISEGLKDANAVIVLISKHSLKSEWAQAELSTIALRNISSRKQQIIPVLIDTANVPSYISNYKYLDLSSDFISGVDRLVEILSFKSDAEYKESRKRLEKKEESNESQIGILRTCLRNGRLTLVCGAGVSIGAGIPS